jgi:hypothetical protein
LQEEALDRSLWRTCFERGYRSAVRLTKEWMNVFSYSTVHNPSIPCQLLPGSNAVSADWWLSSAIPLWHEGPHCLWACVFGRSIWYRKFPGHNSSNLLFFRTRIIGALSWLKFHLRQAGNIGSRLVKISPRSCRVR